MKIENAKNLLIAIKDQIAKNLPDEDSLQFTKEFDNLIDNCNASKTYAKFCIKLLERVKLGVNPKHKEVLLILTAVINLFKNNGTKEEFLKAADAAAAYAAAAAAADAAAAAGAYYAAAADAYYASYASYASYAAYYATFAAYEAYYTKAMVFSAAKAATHGSSDYCTEYKQQSIDLLQVLKTKAGRPKGSKNFIKKEKNVKILIPESLLSRVKKFINKLLKNQTN
jgi:predicted DNA binding CopG/RHH family protein